MKLLIKILLLFFIFNFNLLYCKNNNKSVYLYNKNKIIKKLSNKYNKDYYEFYYLFNQIYLATIDAFYYDKYSIKNFNFCELFSLVLAMIETESAFNIKAIARRNNKITGAGLMQINYSYWKTRIKKLDLLYLFDPYLNVRYGLRIFFLEYKRLKSLKKVLKLYSGTINNYSVFNKYYKKIMRLKKYYQNNFCFLE